MGEMIQMLAAPLLIIVLSIPGYPPWWGILYLTLDKPTYTLGETVTITVAIRDEKSLEPIYKLSLEIYNSRSNQVYILPQDDSHRHYGFDASEFPFKTTFRPPKEDVYTVNLYVNHYQYGGYTYLEDQKTFSVVLKTVTSQTTILLTITAASTTTSIGALTTTQTSSETANAITTTIERSEADWRLVLTIAVLTVLILFFEIRRRREKQIRIR
jgi:hypothetical protein